MAKFRIVIHTSNKRKDGSYHRSCFYRNSIFAKTLHAALLINDKSRSKLVRNIIPRYMKDICISGGI